ncbi:MAG TPA: 6-hydroxynicotinate reductase [Rhodobacteraceae bacterium]|nr:6-hydroxynicotinate reductase [Amylibacter sp.]MDG1236833.1 6-hydroxynicotinate reductase [Amylibacter sp.]MDG1998357.1 6-hydroxynicotinate reductase [Amylibacter sp.]HAD29683.1 6-hydroxynicotinate reductase [Paracoccaceae bacterium]|tara:strand:+ start:1742 stop:3151 length:1410 start_codon:yes stop_codon:yes gene_type:complete
MTDRPEKIRCDACPVLCFIAEGRSGACDRYANQQGDLIRLDPLTVIENGGPAVPFIGADWDGDIVQGHRPFVTAIGAGTTYPDYKPAPFIVSAETHGVDMVTVVTEGIFSYCGVKVKIDTDRYIGEERAIVRVDGEPVGHVMTSEYGSKMLSLGGVDHLTGGSKKEGRITCDALLALCNCEPVQMEIEGGAVVTVQAGKAPVIDGEHEKLMRVGCGSAAIGMFAAQWRSHADEVIVVDDHITGVLSEHQAGVLLDIPPSGIRVSGRRSTPGRYFQVAEPGTGWGGTNIEDPLNVIKTINPKVAWPGLRLFMISTTGEQWAYFELDNNLEPQQAEPSEALRLSAERVAENCEPSVCSVLFMGGAGGSLRAGVTENPVQLTRSVRETLTKVTVGGADTYLWPGGGITVMADVTKMPSNAFGYVPTPALVAPIEFTMSRDDYVALGGYVDEIRNVADVLDGKERRVGVKAAE